jgi:hypothetical protein
MSLHRAATSAVNDHDEPRLGANNFREPWLDRQFKLSAEVGSYSLHASERLVVTRVNTVRNRSQVFGRRGPDPSGRTLFFVLALHSATTAP